MEAISFSEISCWLKTGLHGVLSQKIEELFTNDITTQQLTR
jgi:hypothetical protein